MSDDTTTLHPIPTTQPQPVAAWLVVTTAATPGTVGRSFKIGGDEAIVGRSPDAQVRLMEEGVSRKHARILRTGEGKFELTDLGSTNGTYLNGTRLAGPGRLDEGDRVQLGGQCSLRFTFKETSDGDENLREALAAAHVATFSLDLRNQIIGWNETVERVVSAPAGTLSRSSLPMMDFVHGDDRERVLGALDTAVQGRRQFDAEFRFIRPGVEGALWVAAKGNVMRDADETPLRIVGTLMDVSARKQTEQELRREALLFESLNDGVIFLDLQGSVVDWNSSAERLFGYSKGEVLGRAWSDVLKLSEHNLQATVLAALKRYGRWSREIVALRKDGSETFCEVTVVPLRDAEGRHIATIAVHRDIGERRAMQAQLLVASRLASVGTLAAGVAHEINNPLAFVNANVLYLADELERFRTELGPATDEILQLVTETRQGVERIGLIVRDLKAFSRVDSEDTSAVVDVRKVLAFAEKMAGKEMRQRARVMRDIQPVPMVKANESRLGQVFLNLLLNAAQAIPDGAAAENEIRIRTRTDGLGRAVVEVSDTGRGIPEDLRARVFDPFFTTKPVGEGTGLGLSICLGIVRSLGGEILLESEVGKGSAFRVALPAHQPERATAVFPAPELPPPQRVKLLVVDDEPYICTAIQRLLRREHRVTALTTVREALALLETGERFDVI
ncbi:MAG TPA: PAS domain S-box protein, partial [Myxococcaceae bacterium]